MIRMKRLISMILLIIMLSGCDKVVWYNTAEEQEVCNLEWMLPPGAVNVTPLGNLWYTFELGGRSFLLRVQGSSSLLTELDT